MSIYESREFWILVLVVFCLSFVGAALKQDAITNPLIIAAVLLAIGMRLRPYAAIAKAISSAQYPEAVKQGESLIKRNPRYALASLAAAYAGMRQGQISLEYANKAIEFAPRCAVVFVNRAYARILLGNLDDALEDLSKALEIDPKCAGAFINKADVLLRMGRPDDAIVELKKADKIQVQSKHVKCIILCNLALAKLSLGQISAAKVDATEAIALQGDCAQAHCVLGMILLREMDYVPAHAELSKAIDLDAYCAEAYWYRHEVHVAREDIEPSPANRTKASELAFKPYLNL